MGATKKATLIAGISALALTTAGTALAQESAEIDTVIVTGTRTTGLRAVDSPAPIQVLGTESLRRVGQTELGQALAQNVPSFTAQAFGGDTANLTLSARLRGLSPNHALVLVNGKRRHGTANLAILGGPYQGGAGADLNFIPTVSVERVEVLQDGAAAQYGSDAIAGVINIIMKSQTTGGQLAVNGGRYMDQGGKTASVTGNIGFEPIAGAYLNVSGEWKYHGFSFRGDYDPRVVDSIYNAGATNSPARSYPQIINAPNWPFVNRIAGDAQYHLYTVNFNAGYEFSDTLSAYAFGSYGRKIAQAHQNFRLPNVVRGTVATDIPFPLGFDPRQELREDDYQVNVGFKGEAAGWNWDLSSSYGSDFNIIHVKNTANADLYRDTGKTPTYILAGKFQAGQWTNTLDLTREFDAGMAEPLTVALGAEYREDYYSLKQGELATYYKGGSQSYFGFSPTDASSNSRHNVAVYIDLAFAPVENLKLDLAGRYADFSDFGDTSVFKGTARYDFSDMFALRGTASTGFRAPTLAEGFYSGINVSPSTIGGQLAPNSPGAKLLGVNGLKPEKSTNYSVGFVAHPTPGLTVTFDAYQITIKDRIVGTGTVVGDASNKNQPLSPAVIAALTANGVNIDSSIYTNPSWQIGASLFANGLNTRTRGADFVATYPMSLDEYGKIDWTLSANYNKTKVTKIAPAPSQLAPGALLYDPVAIANLEDASPRYRILLGGLYTLNRFSMNLRFTAYGKSSNLTRDSFPAVPVYVKTTIKPTVITDLEVSYQATDQARVAVGANNLLNTYPNRIDGTLRDHYLRQNSNSFVTQYPTFSPFGINGGYYYGRITYNF